MRTKLIAEDKHSMDLHNNVMKFIDTLKGNSNPDGHDAHLIIEEVYGNGNCYKFAQLLQLVFPSAVLYGVPGWHSTYVSHVVANINNKYYDITGDITDEILYATLAPVRVLTEKDHEICATYTYSFEKRGATYLYDREGNNVTKQVELKHQLEEEKGVAV